MLNDPLPLPMDGAVDTTWAVPSADGRTGSGDPAPVGAPGRALMDALRTAARSPGARVTVGAADSPFAFVVGDGRIAPEGTSMEPPLDQLAAALALDCAAVSVAPDASPATADALAEASIDLETALTQALPLTGAWSEIMHVVPDDRAVVRLAGRLPAGGVDLDDDQWRAVARVGAGRSVGELAPLLEIGHLAAMRQVHDLAVLGLFDVTAAPKLLPTPPAAFAAPTGTPLAPPELPPPGAAPRGTAPLAPPPPIDAERLPSAPPPVAATEPVPAPAAPTVVDDGWTTVSTTAGGDWSYERLSTTADDWLDEPDPEAAAAAWDEQVLAANAAADDGWGVAEPIDSTPTADLWADLPAEPAAPPAGPPSLSSAPTPVAPAAPVAPLVPARAVTPLPAYQRDEIPALPAEPAPAATDEVLGSVVGEDELVNRALLFKFLSSMRD